MSKTSHDYSDTWKKAPKSPWCPRSHADLQYRNPDTAVEDLPAEMQQALADATARGCGHAKATRYTRIKEVEGEEDGPADRIPDGRRRRARQAKSSDLDSVERNTAPTN